MKRLRLFSIVFLFLLFISRPAASEVVERILAVVNDEIITEQDLELVMAPVISQYRTMTAGPEFNEKVERARGEFLDKLIQDKLVLSEAKRKQVVVNDQETDQMISDVRNKFPSREVFLKAINDQGLTEKKLWNRFRDQLMMQKLVAYEVKSKVSVSPGEISEYYKAHSIEFAQEDEVRLNHILVRTVSRSDEEAKTFAESLTAQIRSGKPFDELARTYSEAAEAKEGGQMGWMAKGQLMGEIDQKVFALKPGEITDPIKSSLGYHIFQAVEKREYAVKPLVDVREEIYEKLFKEKLSARLDKWLKELRSSAYISIR